MRKIALGRRNYLFAGSDSGGERAASIYSLKVALRRNLIGINPETYLKEILHKDRRGRIRSTGSTS